jgi:tagatose-1,6-bisphosphate aldolase
MQIRDLASSAGGFALVSLDEFPKMGEACGWQWGDPAQRSLFQQATQAVLPGVLASSTGVIADPVVSWPEIGTEVLVCGTALRLEQVGVSQDPLALPTLEQDWGVEAIAANSSVVKLGLHYHPHEVEALNKKQFVAEIADSAHRSGAQVFLELKPFALSREEIISFEDVVLPSALELGRLVDAISVPESSEALLLATLTAELDIPWVMSLWSAEYEHAKEYLRLGLENGARGFQIGEAAWREISQLRRTDMTLDWPAVTTFSQTVLRDRMLELRRIVDEALA